MKMLRHTQNVYSWLILARSPEVSFYSVMLVENARAVIIWDTVPRRTSNHQALVAQFFERPPQAGVADIGSRSIEAEGEDLYLLHVWWTTVEERFGDSENDLTMTSVCSHAEMRELRHCDKTVDGKFHVAAVQPVVEKQASEGGGVKQGIRDEIHLRFRMRPRFHLVPAEPIAAIT